MPLVFDKCCGCIELKTGCFILGYLNLVGTIILTIMTGIAVAAGVVYANDGVPEHHNAGLAVAVVSGVLFVFVVLALTFAVVLLVGLHKNKPGHLKAYMIYTVIFLVVQIINFIINCASGAVVAKVIIQTILSIALSIYFLLVIRSMYFVMKDPSKAPAVYSSA